MSDRIVVPMWLPIATAPDPDGPAYLVTDDPSEPGNFWFSDQRQGQRLTHWYPLPGTVTP